MNDGYYISYAIHSSTIREFALMDKARKNGFTLIEILVVILIIGIASSIIVISVGNFYLDNKRIDAFAKEMTALISLARNQAIFGFETLGIRFSGNEYTFYRLQETNSLSWQPLNKKDVFWYPRKIPENLIVTVKRDETNQNTLTEGDITPDIMIYPSGELSPFTISIHTLGRAQDYIIKGSYSGKISLSKTD